MYKKILKQSFQLTATQKPLWLYGLIAAVFSGSRGVNLQSLADLPQAMPSTDTVNFGVDRYLALAETALVKIGESLARVPRPAWFVLGTTVFVTSTIYFLLHLFISQWALGALLSGINLKLNRGRPQIASASALGLKAAVPLMILQILPWFVYWSLALLVLVLAAPIFANAPESIKALVGLFLAAAALIYFTAGLILIVFTLILARRLIVQKSLRFTPAVKIAFKLARTHWRSLLKLGLINLGLTLLIGLAWATVLGLTAALGYAIYRYAQIFIVPFGLVFGPAFILLSFWLRAVTQVFLETNWTLLFNQLKR